MLNKLLKKIKATPRTHSGTVSNVVQTFLNEMKSDINDKASRFSPEDEKQLHLSLFIFGEGKGALNKWLFYTSTGDMTSNEDNKAIAELCFGNYQSPSETDATKVHLYKAKGKASRLPSTGILLSRVCRFVEGRTKAARRRNDTSQSSENEETSERASTGLPVGSPGRNEGGSNSSRSSAYFSSTESIFSQSPGRAGSLPRETCPWLINSVSRKSRVDISHRSSMDMFRLTQFMEVLNAPSAGAAASEADDESRKSRAESRQGRIRCDLGFAVLFQSEDADFARRFRSFFFANYGCIESRMVAMCDALVRVVEVNSPNRCSGLYEECFHKFKTEMHDLVFAPRLVRPVWLALSSGEGCSRDWLYEVFLHRCLVVALERYNSKHFVEALVTSVLCHHLAWISTVEPVAVGSLSGAQSSHALSKETPDWPDRTPYNPHCAQINDLYGLLGHPLRLARTLVVGRDQELVEFFLFLTSYFLRCSHVTRRFEELPRCPHPASIELLCDPSPEEAGASSSSTQTSATVVSVDSGLSSAEDIRSAAVALADGREERGDCCGGAGPVRMLCRRRQFECGRAPYLEVPLLVGELAPREEHGQDSPSSQEWEEEDYGNLAWQSEGHSLLAGVHSRSTSFFALQGTHGPVQPEGLAEQLSDMLTNNGVNDEAVEAVCIVVDTDRFLVQEHRLVRGESRPRQCTAHAAKSVGQMLSQVASLARLQLSADMCLRYLEDQLQGIYMSALAFAQAGPPSGQVKALGFDKTDLPLLEAIASVHEPVSA